MLSGINSVPNTFPNTKTWPLLPENAAELKLNVSSVVVKSSIVIPEPLLTVLNLNVSSPDPAVIVTSPVILAESNLNISFPFPPPVVIVELILEEKLKLS